MRLGVIANLKKPELGETVGRLINWAGNHDVELLIAPEAIKHLPDLTDSGTVTEISEDQMVSAVDFLVAMGGDGTILAAMRHARGSDIPVVGINLGSLGFLADTSPDNIEKVLDHLVAGSYEIETRMTLEAEIRVGGKVVTLNASNDIVIDKGDYSRVIDIDAHVGGQFLQRYTGDGLIVSSPTGSTAYALAAGGPILEPTMDALVVVPICPHMLAFRPLVLPEESEIELTVTSKHGTALVTGDGQEHVSVDSGDTIIVRRGSYRNRFVRSGIALPFFDVLRGKLKWGFREPAERS
ncbi:NAD(+)/NADH kinase [Candidatus Zixiibacteriota bacterium]